MTFLHARIASALSILLFLVSAASAQAPAPFAAEPQRPDYSVMADMLEDAQARAAIVEELRRLAGDVAAVAPLAEEVSIARRIARTTTAIAEMTVAEIAALYRRLAGLDVSTVNSEGIADFGQALLDIALVVAAVIAAMYLLRLAAGPVYRRASQWVQSGNGLRPWMRRGMAAIGCSLLDLAIVLAAWVVGYAIALFVLGEAGRMDNRQSLFLNAFLVIETVKVVIRLFLATRYDGLRLLPVAGEDAAYWTAWLSRLASLLGYGILVAVPIVAFNLGPVAGHILSALVYGLALILAVVVVRQNRETVRAKFSAMARRSEVQFVRVLLGAVARTWHIFAILYLCVLALMLLLRPESALSFIVAATVQSAVALLGGMLVWLLISRVIALGVHLQPHTRSKFPMLEERLNAFVPNTLKAVRIVIAIVVAALVLDAWSVFDFFAWVGSEAGMRLVGTVMTVAFIVVAATAIWLLVSSWIEFRLNLGIDGVSAAASARERTLLTIFRNAFTIALVVMTMMVALSELGLDIGPLLAGAGVLGLAIGFGAQKLVQDVITGVFIQLENAMNTGDVVSAGGTTGVVEKLTVRSVGIRDLSGTYHLIPFSSVETVSNFMRGFGYHVGEYGVAYRENIDDVIEVLKAAFEELCAQEDHKATIIGDLEVHGVTEFADSSVNVRVRIKTLPGQQWALGRAYNGLVKKHFDAAGIEMPFPHVTLYFGEDKKGEAPSAPVRLVSMPSAGPETKALDAPARPKRSRRKKKAPSDDGIDIPSEDDV